MKLRVVLLGSLFLVTGFRADAKALSEVKAEEAAARQPGDLEEVQNLGSESLRSVTSVAISQDGKFAYAAAFNSATVTMFTRDSATGRLEIESSITNPDLQTVVSLRLSGDNHYAVGSAFGVNAITLFKRDAQTGLLSILDVARQSGDIDGLNFVVEANFSKDNRFVYTASSQGVGVFEIKGDKLAFVEMQDAGGRLKGLRAVRFSPGGQWLYAAAASGNCVGVLRPDETSGKLEVIQVLSDGEEGVNGLEGAFRVACSKDGKHVYVNSGRFGGDQALSVFAVAPGGKLQLVEEHVDGEGNLEDYKGGNDLAVSPDGHYVYALTTLSDRLFRFQRDPESGSLISIGSQPVGDKVLPGSAGICFSPDGKFVYVADEMSSSIVVYKMP